MRRNRCSPALLGLAVLSFAPPAAGQEATVPPVRYETFTLPNGLRFIVHEDHSTPIAAVNVWYDVGSAHEPPGRSGFAHLFEHMLFQETENLDKGEYVKRIQAAGGMLDGTTDADRTAYFEVVPSNRVNLALWLEAERMANLRVTAENFAREREVVKEERRLRIDNSPYGLATLTADTLSMVWPPYKHPGIGSMEDLNAATPEDVIAFYKRFYVPNNATVVVAGDVTVAQVKELAEAYFARIPRGPDPEPLPPMPEVPRTDGEKRATVPSPLAGVPLLLANYAIPPHRHQDSWALSLLSSIFSEGESSRLYRRLVQQEQAAMEVFSWLDTRLGPASLMIGALPNEGVDIGRIEALIDEEIEELRREGVTERELQKAKNQARARILGGRQTVLRKAEELQHYRLHHGSVDEINIDLEKCMQVTVDDIRTVARRYLTPANRAVVIALPPGPASPGRTP